MDYTQSAERDVIPMNRFSHIKAGEINAQEEQTLTTLVLTLLNNKHKPGQKLSEIADIKQYLQIQMGDLKFEVFGCLFLNARQRIINFSELFRGTVNHSPVYPRVVVEKALEFNAVSVVLFHNHPSGVAEPSRDDERITRLLKEALSLVDIQVLDHIVVSACECVSFSDRGLL